MKCWEGSVFTRVSFCPQGEGLSVTETPPTPGQRLTGQRPHSHAHLLQQAVRILLECILVNSVFYPDLIVIENASCSKFDLYRISLKYTVDVGLTITEILSLKVFFCAFAQGFT